MYISVEDTKTYQAKLQQCLDLNSDDNDDMNTVKTYGDFGHGSDSNILTTSDVIRAQKGLPPQMYDAFVLYADADLNYASEMLTKLEDNPDYSFKVNINLTLSQRFILFFIFPILIVSLLKTVKCST